MLFLELTPNINTIILSGASALKEKFHSETFLFTLELNIFKKYNELY